MSDDEGAQPPAGRGLALFVALVWALAAMFAIRAGVRQISDDDYARTVIAQTFAHSPRFDPSGTSWLPLPFWVTGLTMIVAGRSLEVARVVAILLAAGSGALVFAAARSVGLRPQAATIASLLPLAIPLVPILGACTVPELPTAALIAYAALMSADARGSNSLRAAFAITAAALCRYEAWPVAFLFAVWAAVRAPALGNRSWIASLVALSGPVGWMAWNAATHGNALHFAARVSAYHDALGGPSASIAAYFTEAFALAPIHLIAAVFALAACGPFVRRRLRFAVAAMLVMLLSLTLSAARGGAPTHHPERAVVAVALVASVVLASAGQEALRRLTSQRLRALVVFGGLLAIVLRGAGRALPTYLSLGADRRVDVAAGLALSELLPPGERVLLVPLSYGYFATLAAFARPENAAVISLHRLDPRATREDDPFASKTTLEASMRAEGTPWVLCENDDQQRVARAMSTVEHAAASRTLVHLP